jgi:heat shock protein HslJ
MVNTGCNSGNGGVDILADTIRFGEIALTRMACEGAAADMEHAMLTVMSADVVRYEVDASTLELSIAGFGLQLTGSALD